MIYKLVLCFEELCFQNYRFVSVYTCVLHEKICLNTCKFYMHYVVVCSLLIQKVGNC